jgi:hypothetical protein
MSSTCHTGIHASERREPPTKPPPWKVTHTGRGCARAASSSFGSQTDASTACVPTVLYGTSRIVKAGRSSARWGASLDMAGDVGRERARAACYMCSPFRARRGPAISLRVMYHRRLGSGCGGARHIRHPCRPRLRHMYYSIVLEPILHTRMSSVPCVFELRLCSCDFATALCQTQDKKVEQRRQVEADTELDRREWSP